MGLGGHLLWTAAVANLKPPRDGFWVPVKTPGLSDLVVFRFYDKQSDYEQDVVFSDNPRFKTLKARRKNRWQNKIDRWFIHRIKKQGWIRGYERLIHKSCRLMNLPYLHIDMGIYSYVEKDLPDRQVWKEGRHIVDLYCKEFGVIPGARNPELYFSEDEEAWLQEWLDDHSLNQKQYIVIEPNTKTDWFGTLRAWPFERWEELCREKEIFKDLPWVQVGVRGGEVLPGVLDTTGELSFRQTSLIMKHAALYLGTEGGLMHAAAAVGVPAVILYGGITRPEFSGYPAEHYLICHYVKCIHCGWKGCCPNEHICMKAIDVEEVRNVIIKALQELGVE